jgi:hypothetical protein
MMNWKEALNRYNNFAECLLLDYWSENLCRDVVVLISNIWSGPGNLRHDLDDLAPLRLLFRQCTHFEVENAFTPSVVLHPEKVNWGINEFATIASTELGDGTLKVDFIWESRRTIRISCARVEVEEPEVTAELVKKYAW